MVGFEVLFLIELFKVVFNFETFEVVFLFVVDCNSKILVSYVAFKCVKISFPTSWLFNTYYIALYRLPLGYQFWTECGNILSFLSNYF